MTRMMRLACAENAGEAKPRTCNERCQHDMVARDVAPADEAHIRPGSMDDDP